ncbi:MAG: hypothetical protein H6867_09220 [Rhodospirillales bacterium]|nr:hypothetical protein [Rhodospirillales bacterium]MCB9996019.1 hypothetical protein [Rhodospirillales bacterium]
MQISDLFTELAPIIDGVECEEGFFDKDVLRKRFDELQQDFAADYARTADLRDLLFGADFETFGTEVTKVFTEWETTGSGPSLTALVACAIDEYDLDLTDPCVKAAFLSAILAEYPNDLQYHGNEHYRKVLFHGIRLISVHNSLFGGTNRAINKNQTAILLTASCLHDLGHEGGDNLREGMYTPGQMEQYALTLAKPFLKQLAIPEDDVADIETIVFCTDITFFAGDNSPCVRMKKIYKHYFWDDDREDVSMMMMGKLRRYEDNPRLVLMAMLLHEADVATSAGVSYEQTVKETINIMEERGVTTAGPRTVLAFLREQLGETMFTEAAKQLYGQIMANVIKQAEQDMERGRATYYEE